MTDMIEIIKNIIDAILREVSDYVRNILSKVEDDFNEWKEKYIMLEYAEKIDELLDDACNKLSGEMFNKLLEYVEDIIENHR